MPARKMISLGRIAYIITLLNVATASHNGQFFKITNDNQSLHPDEPFLTPDMFVCGMQLQCTSIERRQTSDRDTQGLLKAEFSKTTGPGLHRNYSSCTEALRVNLGRVGNYRIRHDNMTRAIDVECKFIDNEVRAIVHHDSEFQGVVNGSEGAGAFRRSIKYQNSLHDVAEFVDSSITCRQFTRIDCHGMCIWNTADIQFTFLVDRHGIRMTYLGGGPKDGRGCSCGVTGTCMRRGLMCNCDTNDLTWRYDSGFVTEKSRLPLTEVQMGDTGDPAEVGKYQIGPLQCLEQE